MANPTITISLQHVLDIGSRLRLALHDNVAGKKQLQDIILLAEDISDTALADIKTTFGMPMLPRDQVLAFFRPGSTERGMLLTCTELIWNNNSTVRVPLTAITFINYGYQPELGEDFEIKLGGQLYRVPYGYQIQASYVCGMLRYALGQRTEVVAELAPLKPDQQNRVLKELQDTQQTLSEASRQPRKRLAVTKQGFIGLGIVIGIVALVVWINPRLLVWSVIILGGYFDSERHRFAPLHVVVNIIVVGFILLLTSKWVFGG